MVQADQDASIAFVRVVQTEQDVVGRDITVNDIFIKQRLVSWAQVSI
jgi:hypothetical protein